jgi:ABC-type Fe3+ transport system permease subunit
VIALDLLRASAIAVLATAGAAALAGVARRPFAIALMVAAVATPPIAVGYAWATLPSPLPHDPTAIAPMHALLTALRLAPVALLVALVVPAAPLSAAATHCLRLAGASKPYLALYRLRDGDLRPWALATLAAFLLGFAEFELGSRLDAGTWAVRLFDAQAGGADLGTTIAAAAPGALAQLAALALAAALLAGPPSGPAAPAPAPSPSRSALGWLVAGAAALALCVFPLAGIARDALAGLVVLWRSPGIEHELGASLAFALTGSACAWLAAGWLLARCARWRCGARLAALACACAPGLLGSLALGLAGLGLLRFTLLAPLDGTPIPLALALTALALPTALALRALVDSESPATHAARLLSVDRDRIGCARSLLWQLRGARRYGAFALIFLIAYGDLAASCILHPVDMTPVLPMLYNFMHYGESAALSARLGAALLAPLALIALGAIAVRHLRWPIGATRA